MIIALALAFAAVLMLIVFWRRHLDVLMQVAGLLGGLLLLVWLQDNGYLGGDNTPPPRRPPPAAGQGTP